MTYEQALEGSMHDLQGFIKMLLSAEDEDILRAALFHIEMATDSILACAIRIKVKTP